MDKPLAIKLAPKSLSDIIGQRHLIGEDKIFTNLVLNKKLFSMILFGPPGIGKTSIAVALITDLGMRYRMLNATINNKHDFDVVFEEAKVYGNMVLIVDEIHRLNKDKQDILLPLIESGQITLIGMTTGNPYHKINPAIRSRCHLFELKSLETGDIVEGLNRAINNELTDITIEEDTIMYIARLSANDLRYAYNLLELAYYTAPNKCVTTDYIKSINTKKVFSFDKGENSFYDTLSAFQKSIRGSDVNASLHYLGRLLRAEDLDSIYRRLSVICYEDIGLANPSMGPKMEAAINLSELVGLPEARIILANIVIDLALSPKSNSAIMAIDKALEDIDTGKCDDIPDVIKISSQTYMYPHDYPSCYVKQQYLPNNLLNKKYYQPKKTSSYELGLSKTLNNIEELNKKG